jgi:hypothetical protein
VRELRRHQAPRGVPGTAKVCNRPESLVSRLPRPGEPGVPPPSRRPRQRSRPARPDPAEGVPDVRADAGPEGSELLPAVVRGASVFGSRRGLKASVPIPTAPDSYSKGVSLGSLPPGTGVNLSSSARTWTLRSSSSGDAEAVPHGCRAIRTTCRLPPHGQPVAEDPWREAKPSL